MINFFKPIGHFLLGLTTIVTAPIWMPLLLAVMLIMGIKAFGEGLFEEWRFRD